MWLSLPAFQRTKLLKDWKGYMEKYAGGEREAATVG